MKIKAVLVVTLFFFSTLVFSSEHGIYMLTNKGIKSNVEKTSSVIVQSLITNNFQILNSLPIHVPDYVREDSTEHCGLKAQLIVFTTDEYLKMLTSYGTKYLVARFLKIGVYETKKGIDVTITDPETINRIIFNDLFENEKEDLYKEIVAKTTKIKEQIVTLLHKSLGGEKVQLAMEPIREDDDLAESSRDMFMMVGPLTLFNDEDQFPLIYSTPNSYGFDGLVKLKSEFKKNLESYKSTEDDKEYRWYQNEDDLRWRIIAEVTSPKKDAILIGITRPRTEAVSFNIAGASREDENNMCPGIDHVGAYPIEVLLIQENDKINVYTQRQMHRMDMYFWDAGMSAFMDHMSMPGILDESIKKSLLGQENYKQ